jgi:hypothetical protein
VTPVFRSLDLGYETEMKQFLNNFDFVQKLKLFKNLKQVFLSLDLGHGTEMNSMIAW